jgi:hypothetical protein
VAYFYVPSLIPLQVLWPQQPIQIDLSGYAYRQVIDSLRLVRDREVGGSNPLPSANFFKIEN